MKKIIAATAGCLLALTLAGCSTSQNVSTDDSGQQATSSDPFTFYVKLPNGAQVLCAGNNGLDGGSGPGPTTISCDWANAQHLNKPAAGE